MRILYFLALLASSPVLLIVIFGVALISRAFGNPGSRPRLVWGSAPIINNSYWSKAMKNAGFSSATFTSDFFGTINRREDWDRIISEEYPYVPGALKGFVAFIESLILYDVFFISFRGYFLGRTPLWWIQASALRVAGKKVVVIPYGSDAYVYKRIRSPELVHGLMMSYPEASRIQKTVARDVDYWCQAADVVIPGFMGPDGFGRWDVLIPSSLHIDLVRWRKSDRENHSTGKAGVVNIVHSPNHRGFKGTEFLRLAIEKLKSEGLNVELLLLEKRQNSEVQEILENQADILVEQLIFTGHGLSGLEGMASGLPVVSNLEDHAYTRPFRRWSFFGECPMVSASPETLVNVLRKLVVRPELRHQLGRAGRQYVEKYHGLDSAEYLFGEVIEYVYGRRESLINLYHPLLGEYPNRSAKVEHPLVNNQIVD